MGQDKQLDTWLRQQLFRQRKSPIEKLVLRSAAPGSQGQEIEEFTPPDDGWNSDNIVNLREDIFGRAQADADGMGSKVQRYILIALELGESKGPRFPFRIRGEGSDDSDGEETPDSKGLVSQLMRHNEVMMRQMTMGMAAQLSFLAKQNEMQANQIVTMQMKAADHYQAMEEARSQNHEREMEMLALGSEQEQKTKTTDLVISKVNTLFPLIVSKLSGQKLIGEADGGALQTFIKSLSEEQLNTFGKHMNDEQRILFMKMMQTANEKKE